MPYEHVPRATASGESVTPLLAVAPARFTSLSRHAVSTGCHTGPLPPLVASLLFVWTLSLSVAGSVLTSQGFLEPSSSCSSVAASAQVLFVPVWYGL